MYDITSLESFNRLKKWSTTLTEVVQVVSVFFINEYTTAVLISHDSYGSVPKCKHTHMPYMAVSVFLSGWTAGRGNSGGGEQGRLSTGQSSCH